MIKVAILALLVAVATAIVYEPRAGLSLEQQFEEYNTFWKRTHATAADKATRFENFKINAAKIAELNAQTERNGRGASFGFGKFSDWSLEEFRKLNGFRPSKPLANPVTLDRNVEQNPSTPIDWVAKGMTTPVKDQGQCGSCWAFSTTETVESANLMAGKTVVPGAPQEIVDCDNSDQGCDGGDPQEALQWVQQQGGLDAESCYPYQAQDGNCASSQCTPVMTITSVDPVDGNEATMYKTLASEGPLSICCDAEAWQNYNGGILTADQCGNNVDHAIQLTGYSPSQGAYWIVRNSWGSDWGQNGFIWLSYGENTCAITSETTAARA
jgi:C1A family cysteine protease